MQSEAEQRSRAETAEASLAQARARLANATAVRQASTCSIQRAISKLARNPAVVKKLVLVCHPDKCPDSLSESATELFRFVQSIRREKERGE